MFRLLLLIIALFAAQISLAQEAATDTMDKASDKHDTLARFNHLSSPLDKQLTRLGTDTAWNRQREITTNWYQAKQPGKKKEKSGWQGFSNINMEVVRTIAWVVVVIAFLVMLIVFLRHSSFNLFSTRGKVIGGSSVTGAVQERLIDGDLVRQVADAEASGNYRLAIRYQFLNLLKLASASNIIHYEKEKTNCQYLYEMESAGLAEAFRKVSYYYEFVWYGEASVTADEYARIKTVNRQLENSINNNN